MSANNELYIKKRGKWFEVWERDVDTGGKFLVLKANNLKRAVARAKIYRKENEVEYGFEIDDNCFNQT